MCIMLLIAFGLAKILRQGLATGTGTTGKNWKITNTHFSVAHFHILHGKRKYSDSKCNPRLVYVSRGSGVDA